MAQYLLLVYGTPAHMAEETTNAAKTVPRAILLSYVLGGLLNLGMLMSYLFCIKLDNYQYDPMSLEPLSQPDHTIAVGNILILGVTNGLFPVGNIFYDSFMARYGRAEGAVFFSSLICVGTHFCVTLTITAAIRFMYSFARDGGFPFSKQLAYVEPRTGVPVNCVWVFCVCVMLLQTDIFAHTWFSTLNAIGSVAANGLLFVYGVPCFLRILNRHIFRPASEFSLGRASIPCAFMGVCYCVFAEATISLPTAMPVVKDNLNVAHVFLASIIGWAVISFLVMNHFKWYKGPALTAVNVSPMKDEHTGSTGVGSKSDMGSVDEIK
ncbi:unnamed protein product [Polarella glacialis]|uniref:Amino acid permease/ SLC12A domain-containing protein n=1 Tax=Polarella glacialis TaxID=89957 RepID=A0A813E9C9_POLGL|nr:unnamed protein product [Polarella glacialis]CAE8710099.1 unnamed protein product [Polarella glacialis]